MKLTFPITLVTFAFFLLKIMGLGHKIIQETVSLSLSDVATFFSLLIAGNHTKCVHTCRWNTQSAKKVVTCIFRCRILVVKFGIGRLVHKICSKIQLLGAQTQTCHNYWVHKHRHVTIIGCTNTDLSQLLGAQTQTCHNYWVIFIKMSTDTIIFIDKLNWIFSIVCIVFPILIKWDSEWVISKFNGTSTPKGLYSAQTGLNCQVTSWKKVQQWTR